METYNPFSLVGKTVLVTGASSGIGRGIAIACSKMGASVVLNGRNETRLKETLSMMEEGNHQIAAADLNNHEAITNLAMSLPSINGVVHCAGIGQRVLCKNLTEKDVDDVMDINFKAPVLLQTALLKQKKIMKSSSIVFIASLAVDSPSIGNALYSASKGALVSYASCLAIELAPRLIRVNCILPAA